MERIHLLLPALLPAALVGILGAGCTDYGLGLPDDQNEAGAPELDVSPRSLDFLAGESGDEVLRSFTVANVGDALVEIQELRVEGDAGYTLLTTDHPDELLPGDWFEVDVAWTPLSPGEVTGTAWVVSTDADEPEIPVALTAEGLVPALQITPAVHDFGAVGVACEDDVELVLQNVGEADLTLSELDYIADASLWLEDLPDLPVVLSPGEYATATVRFVPGDEVTYAGTLTAVSDDPAGDRTATQQGEGQGALPESETFPVDADPSLDIIVAVDRSSSMEDDAVSLGAGFSTFASALSASTGDWRIGVVTLDDGCFNGGFLSPDDADVAAAFDLAVNTGLDEEIVDDEALLKLSSRALDEAGPGGCNEGFLREDAPLHVIVVSDEPERSYEQAAAWTWDFWLDELRGALDRPEQLIISGVVDASDCNEGDDGYRQAIEETGGVRLDLCSHDWGAYLSALAEVSVAYVWSYELAEAAVEGTVDVQVDGNPATGWAYDPEVGAVVFDSRPDGDEVMVTYQTEGSCP